MQTKLFQSLVVVPVFLFTLVAGCSSAPSKAVQQTEKDPNQWLEKIEDPKALEWVKARNDQSLSVLKSDPRFAKLEKEIRAVVLAKDRIPHPREMGNYVYNFWQDEKYVHGLLRRMPLADYLRKSSRWETVLDLDQLSKKESENWVWKRSICLPPKFDRCLFALSRGGKDATVVREFDMQSKQFVKGGFEIPEARTTVDWVDQDNLMVGTNWGPGSLAETGFPRIIKLWKRGAPLEKAEKLFEGGADDILTDANTFWNPTTKLLTVSRAKSFYKSNLFVLNAKNEPIQVQIPEDFENLNLYKDQLIFTLQSDWTHKGQTFKSGSLVSVDTKSLQDLNPQLIYQPDDRSALTFASVTADSVYVGTIKNVSGEVLRAVQSDGKWQLTPIALPQKGSVDLISGSPFSNNLFVSYESFLTPSTLYLLNGAAKPTALRQLPAKFDTKNLVVNQYEATSKDGTRVPYFMIHKKSLKLDGSNPTLQYGYGGFNISETPFYSPAIGRAWLNRGGVFVLTNIRGGGEFGPKWHQAALKENRMKAYEDFIAISEDVIKRKVTSPEKLGIMGGSNGGLLVGAAMTLRPDLYKAVVCQVPLLDMMKFHQLSAGKLWVDEYGSADDPKMAPILRSYSPYHNVKPGAKYPRAFFVTSTKDDRVHPGHARKMVAKMIENGNPPLYFENMNGGHSAAANLEERILRTSLEYTYLAQELMSKKP